MLISLVLILDLTQGVLNSWKLQAENAGGKPGRLSALGHVPVVQDFLVIMVARKALVTLVTNVPPSKVFTSQAGQSTSVIGSCRALPCTIKSELTSVDAGP